MIIKIAEVVFLINLILTMCVIIKILVKDL